MTPLRPSLLILGGINGAGKSTTAERLRGVDGFADAIMLNPDREADRVLRIDPGLSRGAAEIRGMRVIIADIGRLLDERMTFVTETVLANVTYRRIAWQAMQAGYHVGLLFVGLRTVDLAIQRVAFRVSKGGHDVTEADIRRRWPMPIWPGLPNTPIP